MQCILRKLKSKITDQEYKHLYPTGSQPGKLYGTAKMHKLPVNGNLNDLPLRPIVSNINTSTCNLAKFLSKLLSPLCQSDHKIRSTKDFIQNIKRENIPTGYKMVSLDVKSLFTNVLLDRTINIILKRIYDDNELRISISRNEMKELLLLCTKKVHFTFNGKIYMQVDSVATGSHLGPVLAYIFMIELEKTILPELKECVKYWKRYVDDTISFVKLGTISYIITKLNSSDNNIQFTFEEEDKGTLPFLDVIIRRKGNSILTNVFPKHTNNDYLNWNAFALDTWKRGTLKTLAERAYIMCSTNELLQMELKYLEKVFHDTNNYPQYIIEQILKQVQNKQNQQNVNAPIAATADEMNTNGKKNMKKKMKSLLPTGYVTKTANVGNKLSACFHVKDVTEFKHNHDIIYRGRCPEIAYNDHYLGETGHRWEKFTSFQTFCRKWTSNFRSEQLQKY